MPVYLFSYHGYRTWMPDHKRGYTKRGEGDQPSDPEMARKYEDRAKHEKTIFTLEIQRALIEEAMSASKYQNFHLHAGAGEPTHVHNLVSWTDSRTWMQVRSGLKSSLSRHLCALTDTLFNGQTVLKLSRGASRKHVEDQGHFNYLIETYLPRHDGAFWSETTGWRA